MPPQRLITRMRKWTGFTRMWRSLITTSKGKTRNQSERGIDDVSLTLAISICGLYLNLFVFWGFPRRVHLTFLLSFNSPALFFLLLLSALASSFLFITVSSILKWSSLPYFQTGTNLQVLKMEQQSSSENRTAVPVLKSELIVHLAPKIAQAVLFQVMNNMLVHWIPSQKAKRR